MFLQVCVCPQGGGGCLPQCMLGCHTPPPGWRNPPRWRAPRWRNPPDGGTPPDGEPPGWRTPPDGELPPGSRLQHTVYERPVHILLECILVYKEIFHCPHVGPFVVSSGFVFQLLYKYDMFPFLITVEEEHGILTFNGQMFSLPHFHFQFKSVNISTILTSKPKNMCISLET